MFKETNRDMYEISKERLLQIAKDSHKSKIKIKQWYPDLFEEESIWEGPGWYKGVFAEGSTCVVKKDYETQTSGYGFYNTTWLEDVSFSTARLVPISNEDLAVYMRREAYKRGYTRENIVSVCDISDDSFYPNTYEWAFYRDTMYTEREGYGGMVVYNKGQWANKR